MLDKDSWPSSLEHRKGPYPDSDPVEVGLVSSERVGAYQGFVRLHTAFVPISDLDEVLQAPGGIGQEVRCWGPHPTPHEGQKYETGFWVDGARQDVEYEALVNTWRASDREVLVPDNGLLMCYGLVPRVLQDGTVCWDDPRGPVIDVVVVRPVAHFQGWSNTTTARITVQRRYLEDYLSLKQCAAVAIFFEQRYSTDDAVFDVLVGESGWASEELPGRRLTLHRVKESFGKGEQYSEIAGCRLILNPAARPITDECKPTLDWPSHGVLTPDAVRHLYHFASIYWEDSFLKEFEGDNRYLINPSSGSVTYGGQWSVGYCDRYGRNHVRTELRKLYEGAPAWVINAVHAHTVPQSIAEQDFAIFGARHIGNRAADLIEKYLRMTMKLAQLSNAVGVATTQEGIGGYDQENVVYVGWWTIPELAVLGSISPLVMTLDEFLQRCKTVYKLCEGLKQNLLRRIVNTIGVPTAKTNGLGSLTLLAVLCQLCDTAITTGFLLPKDAAAIVAHWDANRLLALPTLLFALNELRQLDAHRRRAEFTAKLNKNLTAFGIDPASTAGGWGIALDRVYDQLQKGFADIAGLLAGAM